MRVVITVSLDNRAYQIEEEAYTALRQYMDRSKAGLKDNPDVGEILGDVERAIGEKCAATLRAGKDVVTMEEMASILQEVGPVVEDPVAGPPPFEESKASKEPRRLYRQPKGAMVEGVCMGLSEYFGVDVVIFRLLFAVLTFLSGGIGGGLYLIMVMVVPSREPARRRIRRLPRIHPAILISSAVLIIIAVLTLIPWWTNGQIRALDVAAWFGIFGLSFTGGLRTLAFPMFILGTMVLAMVLAIVLLAKYLFSGSRTK